jgi:hypothetical protein
MNNFTKEELEEIKDMIEISSCEYGRESTRSISFLLPLFYKIQFRIDHYCEPEKTKG